MAKFLLFSDIHVHPHKKSQDRLNDCLECLEWVFQTAIEEKVDAVLFGGDMLHDRQKIDTLTYHKVYSILEKFQNCDFKTYLLVGNHDMWFANSWTVSSVVPFRALKNFAVLEKSQSIDINGVNWHFIPYTHDPITELDQLKNQVNDSYLLAHLAVDGAKLNSAGSLADVIIEHDGDMVKVEKNLFGAYKRAFFGHYHSHQKLTSTVEYIGSPLQLSFGEAGDNKHIIILDAKTDTIRYIENTFSPKHIYVKQSEIENYTKDQLEKNFVCILADDTQDIKKDMSKIEELGVSSVQVKKQSKVQDEHAILDAKQLLVDESSLLERYVEQVQNVSLDKNRLLEIGQQIMRYEDCEKD